MPRDQDLRPHARHGRFSAYRYKALLNGPDGFGPLATYFLGEKMHEPVRLLHPSFMRDEG